MLLFNIVMNFYLYSICVIRLGGVGLKDMLGPGGLRKMANPCMFSAALGLIFLFCGIHMPEYVNQVMGPVGEASVPMAMLLLGIQLADSDLISCLKDMRIVLFSGIRIFVLPAFALAVMACLPAELPVKIVLVLGAVLPPASTISALAANEGGNQQITGTGLVVTTAMSILSIPAAAVVIKMVFS